MVTKLRNARSHNISSSSIHMWLNVRGTTSWSEVRHNQDFVLTPAPNPSLVFSTTAMTEPSRPPYSPLTQASLTPSDDILGRRHNRTRRRDPEPAIKVRANRLPPPEWSRLHGDCHDKMTTLLLRVFGDRNVGVYRSRVVHEELVG